MSALRIPEPEDVLAIQAVGDVQLAPDGERAAFVVAEPFKAEGRFPSSRIWLVGKDEEPARSFTSGPRSDTSPRWAPDGGSLAFLSDRREDGRHQICLVSLEGGEAEVLTDLPASASALSWAPDGTSLYFLMDESETDEERKRKEEKDDALEVERRPKFTRLYRLELPTREVTALTGEYQTWEYAVAPDGSYYALVVSDLPYNWSWYRARLVRLPAGGGEARVLHQGGKQLVRPLCSPTGERVAFLSCTWSDNGVIGGDLMVVPAGGAGGGGPAAARNLTEGYRGSVTWMEWAAGPEGDALLYCAHEEGEIALGLQRLEPQERLPLYREEATFAERAWARFSASADRATLAAAREDARHPRDVWFGRRTGGGVEWTRRTDLHAAAAGLALGETRTVRWKAPDGLEIQGLLVLPPGGMEGAPWPMVVQVHGGPANLWTHRLNLGPTLWAQLLAPRGIAVLLPNPRGSTGWGTEFTEANLGDMGGRDWLDILAGVDHCVERGIADPARLGLGGWSYGGFMTAWGVTQTNRFRAAVMGAGISNWRSFHGVTDIPTWDELFYRASAYEQGNVYDRFSAVHHVRSGRTPTLILHGQEDTCVPVGQAYEFFRALKDHGVETELVVYPREGHGIAEKRHQVDLMRRVIGWYGRHLGGAAG